ncbi:Ldh family oxidoreductase [Streptomyces sp. NPDC012510]|uniref:Ldh family oxidoreductase n=1 Tax=Streptomyces sp. NPDC012510 TaxID=3364838 RepID=UPI0036E37CC9
MDLLGFAATTQAHGVPREDARLLADTLVTAELWGHPSHGMLRLPWYLTRIESGTTAATAATAARQVVSDNGAVLVVDGHEHRTGTGPHRPRDASGRRAGPRARHQRGRRPQRRGPPARHGRGRRDRRRPRTAVG